ncbi:MAG: hypothetical protein ACXABD_15770 [Candidatus Thorarchaeota archaeon]|jgi:hypothetical protein
MGTRHLTCVVLEKEYVIAQYGQWDGYPEGAGVFILEALHNAGLVGYAKMKEYAKDLIEISAGELKDLWTECGADPNSNWVDMEVSNKFAKKYPYFSRDCGYHIVQYLIDGQLKKVNRQLSFVEDGLYCEWVWVIDLDKDTFEVYKGFNKEPLAPTERFHEFEGRKYSTGSYEPAKHLVTFSLFNLPTREDFLEATNLEEEDE